MTAGSALPRLLRPFMTLSATLLLLGPLAGSAAAQSAGPCAIVLNCTPNQPVGPIVRVGQRIPVTNSGFEDAAGGISPVSAMIQQHGWVRGGAEVFVNSRDHCGSYSMQSGGHMGGNGFIYTQLTIPATATAPVLQFYLYVKSDVAGPSVVDKLKVYVMPGTATMIWNDPTRIDPATGQTVGTPLAVYTNLDTTSSAWVRKSVALPTSVAGQAIQLWFVTEINSQVPLQSNNFMPITTDYWLDDVSLWTSTPLATLLC